MKSDYENTLKICADLEKYTSLEKSSPSEACELITQLIGYPDYISTEFYNALKKELFEQLEHYKENCEIIEKEEEIKYTQKLKELKWKN